MSKHRVLLVGCGNMGGALLKGWINAISLAFDFETVNPSPRPDFHVLQHQSPTTYKGTPDILIFAVKPQILSEIIQGYRSLVDKNTVIVSVAAGKPLAFFQHHFPDNKVVRAMPNLPSSVNQGVTLLNTPKEGFELAELLFSLVGKCFWVPEEAFDNMTALTGSGPAYVYLLTEVLGNIIQKSGISKEDSISMATQMVAGSAHLMQKSDLTPAELRKAVTSPKGVTDAALGVLTPSLQDLFDQAIEQGMERSKKLSQ